MSKIRGSVGEALAAVGVILSLIFVGVEIRQNTAAVRGATYQAISDRAASDAFEGAAGDHIPRLFALVREENPSLDDLESEDRERLRLLYHSTIHQFENVWIQVEEGVVDEVAFDRFRPQIWYLNSRSFREFWGLVRSSVDPEFAAHFEESRPTIRVGQQGR